MSKAAELAALIGSQSALSNRNLVINGAMQVAQRGTSGINSAAGGGICADRHKGFSNGGGVFSMEQSSTVPNNEFAYSSKLTVTTADSSIASADYYSFQQTIEGYNIIQTGYGTSDAKRLVLSFWVRSSVTGKYSVTCFNNGGTEGYLNTFNISSADTWQKVELSWIGRTSGTWLKTNGAGMIIRFDLGGGSSGHGTADQWTTTSGYGNTRTADSVDWISTNGATFYMTGLQLEIGEQATPFEHRSYGEELAACQRYYQQIGGQTPANVLCVGQCTSSTLAQFFIPFIVPVRDDPTCSVSDQTHFRVFNAAVSGIPDTTNMTIAATNAASYGAFRIVATVGSGLSAGNATMLSGSDSDGNAGIIKMDAEL